jgi:anti-sigma regulatory factor (Ser/Thr protein kinase)
VPATDSEIPELRIAAPDRHGSGAPGRPFGKVAEIGLPMSSAAPGAARIVIAHCLTGLVSQRILLDAELLVGEVVANSLEHGHLGDADTVLLRVYLAAETLRVEIENPGTVDVAAASSTGRRTRPGGFGLDLVDRLAGRWGVSRTGSTTVWLEMGRA